MELVVAAVPVVFATGGAAAVAMAALPLIVPLVKNLRRISTDSLEFEVFQKIADHVGQKKIGPTIADLQRTLPRVSEDELTSALNNLTFSYGVLNLEQGRYLPKT